MQSKTISITLGKGSISHNARTFIADNVDPNRTPLNVESNRLIITCLMKHLKSIMPSKKEVIES